MIESISLGKRHYWNNKFMAIKFQFFVTVAVWLLFLEKCSFSIKEEFWGKSLQTPILLLLTKFNFCNVFLVTLLFSSKVILIQMYSILCSIKQTIRQSWKSKFQIEKQALFCLNTVPLTTCANNTIRDRRKQCQAIHLRQT